MHLDVIRGRGAQQGHHIGVVVVVLARLRVQFHARGVGARIDGELSLSHFLPLASCGVGRCEGFHKDVNFRVLVIFKETWNGMNVYCMKCSQNFSHNMCYKLQLCHLL